MPMKTTYEKQFMRATQQKFSHIRERSEPKYSRDKKRLLRPAVPVEMTLEDFRTWVLSQFGDEWGSRQCHYGCGRWLTPADFVPDHFQPLNRGGRNHPSNLVVCCESCNDIKNELSGPWFLFLLECLKQMPEEQASMVKARLAKSEKLANSLRRLRGETFRMQNSKLEARDA